MVMRLCSGAGCGRALPEDQKYCDECRAEYPTTVDRAANDPIMAQYRTARWQKFRKPVLINHPFCRDCPAPATVADHEIPARLILRVAREERWFPIDPWAGFYLAANMVGRCSRCNTVKAQTEDQKDWTQEIAMLRAKYGPRKHE
jgi:hypothetical protein